MTGFTELTRWMGALCFVLTALCFVLTALYFVLTALYFVLTALYFVPLCFVRKDQRPKDKVQRTMYKGQKERFPFQGSAQINQTDL
jgi:hypothetical protein